MFFFISTFALATEPDLIEVEKHDPEPNTAYFLRVLGGGHMQPDYGPIRKGVSPSISLGAGVEFREPGLAMVQVALDLTYFPITKGYGGRHTAVLGYPWQHFSIYGGVGHQLETHLGPLWLDAYSALAVVGADARAGDRLAVSIEGWCSAGSASKREEGSFVASCGGNVGLKVLLPK